MVEHLFLSLGTYRQLLHLMLTVNVPSPTPVTANVDGFRVHGMLWKKVSDDTILNLRSLAHEAGFEFAPFHTVVIENPAVVARHFFFGGRVREEIEVDMTVRDLEHGIAEGVYRELRRISGLTGKEFKIHYTHGPHLPPFPKDGVLHLVYGATPPGHALDCMILSLLGLPLHPDGAYVRVEGPTVGYGTVVRDDAGHAIGQIIDDTIYINAPFFKTHQLSGTELLTRAMRRLWNAHVSGMITEYETVSDLEDISRRVAGWLPSTLTIIDDNKAKIELELRQLETELVKRQRELAVHKELIAELALLPVESADTRQERYLGMLRSIADLSNVDEVLMVDDGLYIRTAMIEATEASVTRVLGSYWICIRYDGSHAIWNAVYAHPRHVAHPHISPHGDVCFGNVTRAISKSIAKGDYLDGVTRITSWLCEGYDAKLADTKIEEFPTKEEWDVREHELRLH